MSIRSRLARARSDEGLTLVELLVATGVFLLVSIVLVTTFTSTLRVQQTVTGVTGSTTTAQSAATNIDNGIRNASNYAVTAVGADQLLVARVAGSGSTLTWSCVAWYYSASAKTIRTFRGPVGTKITSPTSGQLATWTLLTTSVTPRTGSTIFTDVDGTSVSVSYDVTGADKKVAMQFTSSRPIGVAATTLAESDKCF